MSVRDDPDSQAEYGFREYAEAQAMADQNTLDANAAEMLRARAWPRVALSLGDVVDCALAGFGAYEVGDIVRVQAFQKSGTWAVDMPARIVARTWRPDGLCSVEAEQWRTN